MSHYKSNLDDAIEAMAKLLPHLPAPRLAEYMNAAGIVLPAATNGNNSLPVYDQPEALVGHLDVHHDKLPRAWLAAWHHHQRRLIRNAQWLQWHREFSEAQILDNDFLVPSGMDDLDGIVAGLILLAFRPMPGPLREKLVSRTNTNWWGGYWAAHEILFGSEAEAMLRGVANDPRLTAFLWWANPDLAAPLVPLAMGRHDLWSAFIALHQPLAELWLGRCCIMAGQNDVAAVAALSLQPRAVTKQRDQWIQRLSTGHARLAYLASRWARITRPGDWVYVAEKLKARSVSDGGLAWFHFFRDIQPDRITEVLADEAIQVPWASELVAHSKIGAEELRQRMLGHDDTSEARLVLRWLDCCGNGLP